MNKEGWTYKKLGEVCESITSGGTPKRSVPFYWNGDIPWIKISNLNGGHVSKCNEYITREGLDNSSTRLLTPGTILYSIFATIGAIGILDIPATTNQAIAALTVKKDYNRDYIFYILKHLKSYFENISKGVAQNNINLSILRNKEIPVPPLPVQQRIVSELDQLSDIIAMKRKQVEEYDALTQSVFYEMFGDPIINDKGWNVSKLSNVVSFKNGLNFKQSDLGETFKFIGVGDFGEKKFIDCEYLENYVHINETIPSEYFLQDNDIVIVRSNGSKNLVGRGMLVKTGKTRTLYSGFCIRCRISDPNALSPTFLITFLMNRSIKFILRNEGRGANISNINQKMLSNLPIPLPSLPLQHAFAAKVRAIERQKQLVNDSIRELQTLLDSRMQEYFG